jgi:hypothetical protein
MLVAMLPWISRETDSTAPSLFNTGNFLWKERKKYYDLITLITLYVASRRVSFVGIGEWHL